MPSEIQDQFCSMVHAVVLSSMVENIRCVRLATGQLVYEFTTAGGDGRVARIDANAYELALSEARHNVQDEKPPEGAAVGRARRRRPSDV